jgi:hypothetical protein
LPLVSSPTSPLPLRASSASIFELAADLLQPWHGTQCILHVPSCWISWNWPRIIRTSSYLCFRRRIYLHFSVIDWHAAMACESHTTFYQSRKRCWNRIVLNGNRHVILSWDWTDHWIECYTDGYWGMSSSIFGSIYSDLYQSQNAKPCGLFSPTLERIELMSDRCGLELCVEEC